MAGSIVKRIVLGFLAGGLGYYLLWPIEAKPVAWSAPEDRGFTDVYEANTRLSDMNFAELSGHVGPEDADVGPDGLLYTVSHDGVILRGPLDGPLTVWAETGGRPLGMEFGPDGTLWVADAYRGLLSISPAGAVSVRATEAAGVPILYADDVDIAPDGRVYFSDASTHFGAEANGGTLPASVLDLIEHGASGRVLRYDPATDQTDVFADGLQFANGIAVSHDGALLMVVETGNYRVLSYEIDNPSAPPVVEVENLPGFPDNINNTPGGYWLGLVSPRNALMDKLSGLPFLRKVVLRLPDAIKPAPTRHGMIIRLDEGGHVIGTWQDPSGAYALTTGAVSLPDGRVAVTSLTESRLGILTLR